jgi:alpha-glucosidase (family GH31 glycosyl hydrolase)
LNPFARLNDFEILPYYKESNKKAVESAFKLRATLNMYIYAYMLKNAISGGSFVRPMFVDFKSENMKNDLHEIDSQVMLGSHIMMSPVISFNQRKKRTYFPDETFYDFYTGQAMNPKGEQYISVDAALDKLPLFARAGFVTPLQTPPENLSDLIQMRRQPVEILIALDSNYRSTGRIYIDDGKSN